MKENFTKYSLLVFTGILTFGIIFGLRYVWGVMGLPSAQELIDVLVNYVNLYGLWVVLLAAFLESLLFVGMYFPGTIIIFTVIAATGADLERMIKVIMAASLGMLLGYCVDYMLGRLGFSKLFKKLGFESEIENFKIKVSQQGIASGIMLYALPGFGSLLSVSLGVMRYSIFVFLIFIISAILFWNTLWGILGFFLGGAMLEVITGKYFSLIIGGLWFLYFYKSGKFDEVLEATNQPGTPAPRDDSNYKSSDSQ